MVKSSHALFISALLTAAGSGLLSDSPLSTATASFPGWPQSYQGQPLHAQPLSAKEAFFARDFPGRIQPFLSGNQALVLRWIHSPSRKLHPARHCYQGAGYTLSNLPMQINASGQWMSCFRARRETGKPLQDLRVCEYISRAGEQRVKQSWADVSSWYWQVLLQADGKSQGWWSWVIAEPYRGSRNKP